jgi:hypothetical protein
LRRAFHFAGGLTVPHKITNTGNATFDDGVSASHATFQTDMSAAPTQSAANTTAKAHFARVIALADANGIQSGVYRAALADVGRHA